MGQLNQSVLGVGVNNGLCATTGRLSFVRGPVFQLFHNLCRTLFRRAAPVHSIFVRPVSASLLAARKDPLF